MQLVNDGIIAPGKEADNHPHEIKPLYRSHDRNDPDQVLRAEDLVGNQDDTEASQTCLADGQLTTCLPPVHPETSSDERHRRSRLEQDIQRSHEVERAEGIV